MDGILEVRRAYGGKNGISQLWRVSYSWDESSGHLILGKDETLRPPPASLRPFADSSSGISMTAPAESLPLVVPCTRMKDGRIQIGEKVYQETESRTPVR